MYWLFLNINKLQRLFQLHLLSDTMMRITGTHDWCLKTLILHNLRSHYKWMNVFICFNVISRNVFMFYILTLPPRSVILKQMRAHFAYLTKLIEFSPNAEHVPNIKFLSKLKEFKKQIKHKWKALNHTKYSNKSLIFRIAIFIILAFFQL